ncbi:Uncharacterised protein [Cedecea neteri]|uniref:Uncharacterized protein n=1 Tax=Cedecea neteri TaxID=158822 RepID=A0A291E107_9ENTR|nr:hypothetical protein [Cedecea neteri]ATF93653.1 hypothetical protein CO704_16810 [Cedecea neteri]SQA96695.1 Uncharacterised protein [Cedecea neteri]
MPAKIIITIQDKGDTSQVEVVGEQLGNTTENEIAHATAMVEVITWLATEINGGELSKRPFSDFMMECIKGRMGRH